MLSCALLVCGYMMVRSYIEETEGDTIYQQAVDEFIYFPEPTLPPVTVAQNTTAVATESAEDATSEPEPETTAATTAAATRPIIYNAEDVKVNFDGLKAVNSDIVGWIIIENTTVSYPVLHGTDNEKYLNTTYNNRYSKYGSIFIDYRLASSFDIAHTVIYGHNMRNSSMFGTLLKYSTKSYWQDRKHFHIILPEGTLKYEIFSAYKAQVDSDTYIVSFRDDERKAQWLETLISWSDVAMGVTPGVDDKIVTLSTCTSTSSERDEYRYVVHGRLVSDSRPAAGS